MRVCNFTANWNNWAITFSFVLEIMSKLEMCRYGQLVIKFLSVILNIQQTFHLEFGLIRIFMVHSWYYQKFVN